MTARIGQGVDVHAFSGDVDRPLRLAGIVIPDAPGLAGHSDADVVLHAVVDSLLGAAALGDIGEQFGTADPRWADADSATFVRSALDLVRGAGYRVENVDVTVVALRPRLAAHRGAMRARLAQLLEVAPDRVSVKATTTDGLGFTGRGEGVACLAVALLERRSARG